MASDFPRSPRILKGALVTLAGAAASPKVIAFQFNPETLTRTLSPRSQAEGGVEVHRFIGPPTQTLQLDAELDATDRLEASEPEALANGLHGDLAALEALLYPDLGLMQAADEAMNQGLIEVTPFEGPLTLFVWGTTRVLPVQLTELSIAEEAFDPNLNPIRATVSLSLRVLSSDDLPPGHFGRPVFEAYQRTLQARASKAVGRSLAHVLGEGGELP